MAQAIQTDGSRKGSSKAPSYETSLPHKASLRDVIASDDIEASLALDRIVSEGIDARVLDEHAGTIRMMVGGKVLPKSTLQHNTKRKSGRVSSATSERLVRVLRIRRQASEAFGEENADKWLETPLRRFEGRTPMQMLGTEAGARAVEQFIGRAMHGFNA